MDEGVLRSALWGLFSVGLGLVGPTARAQEADEGGWATAPSASGPDAPWQPDWGRRTGRLRVPLAASARPATTPEDHFEIFFSGGASFSGSDVRGLVLAEADYGFTDQLEIGISLLRMNLVEADEEGGGLESPIVRGRARVALGPFELGGGAAVGLPLDGFRRADVEGFAAFHAAQLLRVDLRLSAGGRFDADRAEWPAATELRVVINPVDRLALEAGARLETPDLGRLDLGLRPFGRIELALGARASPPVWAFFIKAEGPAAELRGPTDRFVDDLRLEGGLTLFFDDPNDGPGAGPDPW